MKCTQCKGYMENKVDGVKMKTMTAATANLAKVVQTRSATALLKHNMLKSGDLKLIGNMTNG